jgi:hypothetical protein
MGRTVDRGQEHPGTSDTAIIAARRLLLREAPVLQREGHGPAAVQRPVAFRMCSAVPLLRRDVSYEETLKGTPMEPVR